MKTATGVLPAAPTEAETFQTEDVLSIVGGHFINDTYSAFFPTLLPLLIEKLSLSLTQAGLLSAIPQIPSLLNPFIGYLADRLSLRYFVIFAPGMTATFFSLMGLAPNFATLAILLFASGISSAAFHAPAPAMIAKISGRQLGKGMSLFMAGGELGRTIGPLLAVWGVTTWTLEGFWRLMVFGWAATVILFLRLHNIHARPSRQQGIASMLPLARRIALPLITIVVLRFFAVSSISIYLPTFMDAEGATLWVAGGALAITQAAGVAGALLSGSLSDRWGRRQILMLSIGGGGIFLLMFLNVSGWLLVPVLLLLGLFMLSTQPVLLAVVQEQFPEHRALANGLFMLVTFAAQSLTILFVGWFSDRFGLRNAYFVSAMLSLAALPIIFFLPVKVRQVEA
ncbi:MAG: MFS transporter [Anaerolineales bacterium]|jgi:FSR family fosmidomycin resistance protein-like MFS transporter